MKKMSLWEELVWRGLVKDVSSPELEKKINEEKIIFYWGTDPTADSLHLGHYSSLVTAKRLAKSGHQFILLVGGATALIGDPRPTAEREIISKESVNNNILGIQNQVKNLVDDKTIFVNNYDWMKGFTFLDFLRDVGKYINVNYMLDKDIISRRLETGITFSEFSYTLMQGYDFVYLNRKYGCTLQAAGSDQWGNITTGIELAKKMDDNEVFGFTMPLILDSNGNKFGKSEGNALWLDKNKTSSYQLYQHLINTDDAKVEEYLKVFTFLEPDEIINIMEKHNKEPHLRIAQKALTECVITDIRGKEEYEKAKHISECLFSDKISTLTALEVLTSFSGVPTFNISDSQKLIDLLVDNNVCSSRREVREMLASGAILINNEKVSDENLVIDKSLAIDKKVLLIRKGKKKYYIAII